VIGDTNGARSMAPAEATQPAQLADEKAEHDGRDEE
jgi:hypothetical protein